LLLESALHQRAHQFFSHDAFVLFINQPIPEDPRALIPPKSDQTLFCGEFVDSSPSETLVYPAQISEIEDIVELDRCSGEQFNDLPIKLERAFSDLRRGLLHLGRESFEVVVENSIVNSLQILLRREDEVISREKRQQSRIHHCGHRRGKQRTDHLSILDDLLL
jgi:hypothetical protein